MSHTEILAAMINAVIAGAIFGLTVFFAVFGVVS